MIAMEDDCCSIEALRAAKNLAASSAEDGLEHKTIMMVSLG
jgi:hypothetical protein